MKGPSIKIHQKEGYRVKFLLVGDSKVGKTNIINRFIKHKNERDYKPTIGIDEYQDINFKIEEDTFVLKIIDTSGNKKFIEIIKRECVNTSFVIVVFDITNKDSFLSVENWVKHCSSTGNKDINFILVGNKNDIEEERKISLDEANSFAEKKNMNYYDISAFKDEDVKQIFDEAFNSFYSKFIENKDPNAYQKTRIKSKNVEEKDKKNKYENKNKCFCF